MTAFASLNGVRVVSGSLTLPLYGMWVADVVLATDDAVPDSSSLTLGDLSLQGFVFRQGIFAGQRTCRLMAGFGGWRKTVAKKQYDLASGVMLSLVLNDVAAEVGEKVAIPNDTTIGNGFVREEAPASRVLRQLAGPNWYIDPAGVTQIQAWPSTTIGSHFDVIEHQSGEGRATIATETYSAWMPNASFSSPFLGGTFVVAATRYAFEGDGTFRLEVLTQ